MVSSTELQRQVDELNAAAPHLRPLIWPRGLEMDVTELARREGPTALEAVCDLLNTVSDDGVQTCSVCGAPGNLQAGGLSQDQDPELGLDGLYFEACTSINWAERTIQLQKGMFCCQQCHCAHDLNHLLELATCKSFHVPCSLEASTAWVQELLAQSYALRVIMSNVGGWKAVGPDKSIIFPGRAGQAYTLLGQLLGNRGVKMARREPIHKSKRRRAGRLRVAAYALQEGIDRTHRAGDVDECEEPPKELTGSLKLSKRMACTDEGYWGEKTKRQRRGKKSKRKEIGGSCDGPQNRDGKPSEVGIANGISDNGNRVEILGCRFVDDAQKEPHDALKEKVPGKERASGEDSDAAIAGHMAFAITPDSRKGRSSSLARRALDKNGKKSERRRKKRIENAAQRDESNQPRQ